MFKRVRKKRKKRREGERHREGERIADRDGWFNDTLDIEES